MIKYLEYLPGWMAHRRGMVQDMRQGGKEKRIGNSVNHTIYNYNTLIPDRSLAWLCLNIIFPRRCRCRSCVLLFVMALIFFAAYCTPSLKNPIIFLCLFL